MNKLAGLKFYDAEYPAHEQMPRVFHVDFEEKVSDGKGRISVFINGKQLGDSLTDNAYTDDGYRYHDIFHLSYLAVLGWSACMRKLFGKKRKSNLLIDEVEDGARATSVEEGLTSAIFSYAEQHNFFEEETHIDSSFLEFIKLSFNKFEVKDKSVEDWQKAILTGFRAFRQLRRHGGGRVQINMYQQHLRYIGKFSNENIINAV